MQKNAFLVTLLDALRVRLPAERHGLAAAFSRQFWSRIPDDELDEWAPSDAVDVTVAAFRHFETRRSDAVDVVVLNPERERDGWSSRHTVVLIAHPDMPFITDSVLMQLSHTDIATHHLQNVVLDAVRDGTNRLVRLERGDPSARGEALIYAEVARLEDARLAALRERLEDTLADVRAVVSDFGAMKARLGEIVVALEAGPPARLGQSEVEEGIAFLRWLLLGNFTFLGYREFDFADGRMRQIEGTALGMLKNRDAASTRALADQPESTRAFVLEPKLLAFSKSGTRSLVHRPAYPDYVAVKRFDGEGRVVGERGFLGLYTSPVYTERPERIPVVRTKVANVKARSGLRPDGFDGKVLSQVLASHPRDELFQASEDELLATALAITYIHERRRTRVFLRRDRYGLFYSCLVYLPRERYDTALRVRIQLLLCAALGAEDAPFDVLFSESILVRLHFVVRVTPGKSIEVDIADLERQIVLLARDWMQDLREALVDERGEVEARRLSARYADAFPAGYRERFEPRGALADIADIERLTEKARLRVRLYRLPEEAPTTLHLKVFHLGAPLSLSELLPVIEHMGVQVVAEHPFAIGGGDRSVAIHDLELRAHAPLDLVDIGVRFEAAFVRIWTGVADNDAFNRLVLSAGLDWREVTILRAYARYLRQLGFAFALESIGDALVAHPEIATRLVAYFAARFAPDRTGDGAEIAAEALQRIDGVSLLNEDRILRRYVALIGATQRTNYYRAEGDPAAPLVFKLSPASIPEVPHPIPRFEIWVFSPRVEGVHLRGGPIARGGIRWSDRHEDFRTEVLGLVKAQVVKNAVIVPTGAKGGFVVRHPSLDRDVAASEGLACYREFIGGLLDVTDNWFGSSIRAPDRVRRHDGDDAYLVVAADKGTATFSDAANAIAVARGFWLGDAFASGGSNGYDHKKIGITARGAWISVQRHFAERGVDVDVDPITVLGIGDMSGDVFGNGLLRSRAVRLVAAFNHEHVFLDPEPDPLRSFDERARLFALPGSKWSDYDRSLLSRGGAIVARSQKSVVLSPEARARFGIDRDALPPDELIRALLSSAVDLIWNGGIGTYVKARAETHADVGDRANDGLRVDAADLKARAFAEGGNLGMTQRARIEFALAGGAVNADFIDNSAGVDCSDHEVNAKILLDRSVATGDLTVAQRNDVLGSMTDAVADLVLIDNFRQAQALSIAVRQARFRAGEYQRFITKMEAEARLDRALEGVPSDDALGARNAQGQTLTRPELAVLLAYAKIHLKEQLQGDAIERDPVVSEAAFDEFPTAIRDRFAAGVRAHPLFREIVATMVANDVVHHLGITSVAHLSEFVGGEASEIARAYYAAAACFAVRERFREVERLRADDEAKLEILQDLLLLARRATRWLLRHRRANLDVAALTAHFKPRIDGLLVHASALMGEAGARRRQAQIDARVARGVPVALAGSTANAAALAITLPVIDAAERARLDLDLVAAAFAQMNSSLAFDWFAEQLMALPASGLWQAMERDAMVDELVTQHAALAAIAVRAAARRGADAANAVASWLVQEAGLLAGWRAAIETAQRAPSSDFALYSMTLRKLGDVTRALQGHAD